MQLHFDATKLAEAAPYDMLQWLPQPIPSALVPLSPAATSIMLVEVPVLQTE